MKLKKYAVERLETINKAIRRIENSELLNIRGSLRVIKKNSVEYYHCYRTDGAESTKYIPKGRVADARRLAMKAYYKKLLPILKKEKRTLEVFLKNYTPEEKYTKYDNMPEERKSLCKPMFISVKDKVSKWQDELYEANPFHQEELHHKTKRGELVRSKSEMIIAGMLDSYKELDYRYEKPLKIEGFEKPFYPDFTIINKNTGDVYYLEHFGMMDRSDYSSSFVSKMEIYAKNNILYGKNFFFSLETQKNGIDAVALRKTIERML